MTDTTSPAPPGSPAPRLPGTGALVLGLAIWAFRNVLGTKTLLPAGALEE